MPAPVTYTKAKDDPLHSLGRVQADVACATVGSNYVAFEVLRGTKQYRAVCIFVRGEQHWEIYGYRQTPRSGLMRSRHPLKDGPTATIVRLNVEHSRAWHQHARPKLSQPST